MIFVENLFPKIGYIQYEKRSSVPVALGLNGTQFQKHTVSIQATMAEKNRVATTAKPIPTSFKEIVNEFYSTTRMEMTAERKSLAELLSHIKRLKKLRKQLICVMDLSY